ncbi:MAG TPA: hypothetical protein DDW91_07855 [Shewanella frigidimarina]|nr:hypothetical protein [Shewanella frigidimarina]
MLIYESIYKYVTHIFDWRYILHYYFGNNFVTLALVIVFRRKVPPRIVRAFIVNLFLLGGLYAEF